VLVQYCIESERIRRQNSDGGSGASRGVRYLIEPDNRAIKRRCARMAGFKFFASAAITIAGIELAHRIRKGQPSFGRGRHRSDWSRKDEWLLALP
jgi:transposase-like protein